MRLRRTFAWLFVFLLSACFGAERRVPDPSSRRTLGPGEVVGHRSSFGNHAWLGLRYAQPPLGDLRFRAPRPWQAEDGERATLNFGNACSQLAHPFGYRDAAIGTPVGSEDCLFLNVFAPHMTGEEAKTARLPVMVWLHGGGNVVGWSGNHDGGNLAQRKRVIVVTINYRVGPLGFFRHAALAHDASPEDASGNYALLDQIQALRWVRDHIAGFGGDPERVTIWGESAGARNVLNLMLSPLAKGLFHRAIAQSGSARHQGAREAEAYASEGGHKNSSNEVLLRLLLNDGGLKNEAEAKAALAKMSLPEVATYLRTRLTKKLMTAYQRDADETFISLPNVIADGLVIPTQPALEAFASRAFHDVPLLVGTNRDENKTFLMFQRKHAKRFTPLYIRLRDPDRYNALADALSKAWRVMGSDAIADAMHSQGGRSYRYRFDWDEQPNILGAELSTMLGAGHGIEIPFVFGHFDLGGINNFIFNEANARGRKQLSEAMMGYWAQFAREGAPGDRVINGRPVWPSFGADGPPPLILLDAEAGGGIRVDHGTLDADHIIESVDVDPRLRNPRERCAVFRELILFSQLLPRDRYPSIGKHGCKDFPIDVDPWGE